MKKLIIISLLAAMAYGGSRETPIKAMFNSAKNYSNVLNPPKC